MRHALAEALALIRLAHGDGAARAAAATTLAGLHSLSAVPGLKRLEADAGASAAERQAAAAAIKQIERWTLLTTALETAFQGASLASILLLMALGLAIVFGLMGVINMAHGELMALGRLHDLRRAELVPGGVAAGLRRLLPGRAAAVVPGGGGGGGGAGAWGDPPPVRPSAGDAAAHLGRLAHHPAGTAPVVRRRQRRRELAPLAVGRRAGDGRRCSCPTTGCSSSGWPRSASPPCTGCCSAARRGPAHPRGHPEPRR